MSLAGIFFLLSGLLATISNSKGKEVKSPVMSVDLQVLDIVIIETRTDHTTGSMNWRSDIFPAFFTFHRHPLASIETSYLESNRCLCSRQNLSKLQPSCHGSCREYDCTNCNSHCGSYLSFVIEHLGFSAEILSPFFCFFVHQNVSQKFSASF